MDDDQLKFEAWKEYEKTAMHFNELLIQLRLRALAAFSLIVTLGGFIAKDAGAGFNWLIISGIIFLVIAAWIAIYVLDFQYYNKLLLGSVDALIEIEETESLKSKGINLSTYIERKLGNEGVNPRKIPAIHWFYQIPLIALTILFSVSLYMAIC